MNKFGVCLVAMCSVAGTGFAQSSAQFGASKSAFGLLDKMSSRTADLQYRLYVQRDGVPSAEDPKSVSQNESVISQVRTNWTWGFYNDVWKNKLTLAATSVTNDNDQKITSRQPRLLSTVDAITTPYFSLVPNLDLYAPTTGEGTRGDLGIIPKVMLPEIETRFGGIALSFRIEAEAQLSNVDKEKSTVQGTDDAKAAFALTSTPAQRKQGDPDYEVSFIPQVDLNLGKIVSGLALSVYAEYETLYEKKVEVNSQGAIQKEVWSPTRYTETYVDVGYAINESLAIVNSTQTTTGGFYGSRWDNKYRFLNLSMLSYTLF